MEGHLVISALKAHVRVNVPKGFRRNPHGIRPVFFVFGIGKEGIISSLQLKLRLEDRVLKEQILP